MEKNSLELMKERGQIYGLLGRAYLKEVDERFLSVLKGLNADGDVPNFERGLNKVQTSIIESSDPLTDFAVDYARIFLGAGVVKGVSAYPYESVYTSSDHLVMQDAYEQVLKIYRAHGITKAYKDLYEDHIGLELEFMSILCLRASVLLEQNKNEDFEENLQEQKNFLRDHLLNWTGDFFSSVQNCPGSGFYKGISEMAEAFLETEKQLFNL